MPDRQPMRGPVIGGAEVRDIRLASNRELPAGTEVRLAEGPGPTVSARLRFPGTHTFIELGRVRIVDGVVLLPDQIIFAPSPR